VSHPHHDDTEKRRWLRVSRRDRAAWLEASTLLELGELTAQWLEGDLNSQPGYQPGYGPDEETQPLIPVLAELNRVGFLTDGSQPGFASRAGFDGATWAQRPAVAGFLDDDRAAALADLARRAGFEVVLHPSGTSRRRGRRRPWIPVTTRDGVTYTGFGSFRSQRDLRFQYEDLCHPTAVAAVTSAAQVAIVDPVYADRSELWAFLSDWAGIHWRYVAEHVPGRAHEQTVTALLALLAADSRATAYLAEDPAGPPARRTVLYLNPGGVLPHDMTRWPIHDQDVRVLSHVPRAPAAYLAAFPAEQPLSERLQMLHARTDELTVLSPWTGAGDPWCEPC